MLETDENWANQVLTETLSGNTQDQFYPKIEPTCDLKKEAEDNKDFGFGVDLGRG